MTTLAWWALFLGVPLALLHVRVSLLTWTLAVVTMLAVFTRFSGAAWGWQVLLWILLFAPLVLLWVPPLRRTLFSDRLFDFYRASMPELSRTEREALEAGTTWWDAELFTGRPRWQKLLKTPAQELTAAERAFLEGPVETFCGMLDDWRDNDQRHDISPEAWAFLKANGFFGMVIPPEFGGKGFSQTGHAEVIMKIASRSISGALTVMIPNSVGPGKLLLKYGTDAQKAYWLPRLAAGEEIPCFALTGPQAGSDAGAIPDTGVVCERDGVLGVLLNFDKRYITLGPVATVIGLAFKLYDPNGLLTEGRSGSANRSHGLGVTLALVPADTPGVDTGNRHDPMHMSFMNGPVRGTDVFVPLDALIGGPEYAGKGWRMLMECLTDGRSISLPALSTAAAKLATRATSAYARLRVQFRTPIGRFEGVEEALARVGGNTYAMDSTRRVTLAALDLGHKPSVISAIVKYNLTARARQVIADAMDIHGGAAVCLGPRNVVGMLHRFPPVAVTVEGANILTRSMITFGQGAIRCHPYLLAELEAASNPDSSQGARQFDRAVTRHIGFSISNGVRTLLLGLSNGHLSLSPRSGVVARHYRALNRLSAAFALTTDLLLLTQRGELKRRERLSARMADVLSQLYIASTVLKRFDDDGAPEADLPAVAWACADATYRAQHAFQELFDNLPQRWLAVALRWVVFPLGRSYRAPGDAVDHALAAAMIEPSVLRDHLTAGMYLPTATDQHLGRLEDALRKLVETDPLRHRRDAGDTLSDDERAALQAAEAAQRDALAVDDFTTL